MTANPPSPEDFPDFLDLVDPKYRPVLEGRPPEEQAALATYFFPWPSDDKKAQIKQGVKPLLKPTRPQVVAWYCPFASQDEFPSRHRYCINVYVGCAHECTYCYTAGYVRTEAKCKPDFPKLVDKDLQELERFDVPPAPVHLSNSTDPFQAMEERLRHTKHALESIRRHRRRFTTVTLLTKNPLLPVRDGYVSLLQDLARLPADHPRAAEFEANGRPVVQVQVSLAFWRDEAHTAYEPGAPDLEGRKAGVRALREAGIPVVLRIDPLFPRSPLPGNHRFAESGLIEPQTMEDLEALVKFAREVGAAHVVYSPARIVLTKGGRLSATMEAMREVYRLFAGPEGLEWKPFSWRLPPRIAKEHVCRPLVDLCCREGVVAKFCKEDLVETW